MTGRPALLNRADTIVGLIILAVCGYLYYLTTTFETVSDLLAQNISAGVFPTLVLAIIALLALGLPLEHILHRRRGGDIDSERGERIKPMAYLTAGLLVLLVFGTHYLGTIAIMVTACAALPLLWGERRLRLVVPFALLFPAAVAILFAGILGVQFEPGALGLFGD